MKYLNRGETMSSNGKRRSLTLLDFHLFPKANSDSQPHELKSNDMNDKVIIGFRKQPGGQD